MQARRILRERPSDPSRKALHPLREVRRALWILRPGADAAGRCEADEARQRTKAEPMIDDEPDDELEAYDEPLPFACIVEADMTAGIYRMVAVVPWNNAPIEAAILTTVARELGRTSADYLVLYEPAYPLACPLGNYDEDGRQIANGDAEPACVAIVGSEADGGMKRVLRLPGTNAAAFADAYNAAVGSIGSSRRATLIE